MVALMLLQFLNTQRLLFDPGWAHGTPAAMAGGRSCGCGHGRLGPLLFGLANGTAIYTYCSKGK